MCVCVKHWEADSVYVLTYLANKNGSDSDSELGHMHRCTILFFNLLTAADLVSCDLTCLVLAPRSALSQRPSEWTWIRSEYSAVTHRLLFCSYRVQLRQRTLIYIYSRGLTETMCRPSRCCHLDVPDKPEKQVSTKLECNPEPKQSSWALQPPAGGRRVQSSVSTGFKLTFLHFFPTPQFFSFKLNNFRDFIIAHIERVSGAGLHQPIIYSLTWIFQTVAHLSLSRCWVPSRAALIRTDTGPHVWKEFLNPWPTLRCELLASGAFN